MTPLLEAQAVSVSGRLEPTSLQLGAGTLTALIGPNGSGKTSLLRALAGVELTSGSVRIAGESLGQASPARRRALLSFLPASRDVTWPISARDVIALGLSSPDPSRVAELVDLLELGSLADRPVDRLSTGERARVLLARALASKPRLLLLDEPLSNLDPYWVLRTLALVQAAVGSDTAALVSLHDLSHLPQFDRAILVHRGWPVLDGSPEQMRTSPALVDAFRVRLGSDWRIEG